MDGRNLAMDQVIAELVGMGFDISKVTEAVEVVGPSLNSAIEFILNGCRKNSMDASSSSKYSTSGEKVLGKRALSSSLSFGRMRQSSILDHLQSAGRPKLCRTTLKSDVSVSEAEISPKHVEGSSEVLHPLDSYQKTNPEASFIPSYCKEEDIGPDWEHNANILLHKHFGYSSMKSFQKEALAAWIAHKDCLVLAATGSGKSLCFQIPALLTGKIVVVISPLISLMHDQCLKLAKHGVSACFLGSGQIDRSVEQKAMKGLYGIIYVCPETILRLITPLQGLAERRGIALFAIDEVHCVSKWGHDFRPDYRRLSVLRENFKADNLKFLKFDIPVMALTATATIQVREDILKTLHMSKESKIVLTSFFRPNLRFSVKHSRTSSPSSYETDFRELIDVYSKKQITGKKHNFISRGMEDAFDNSSMSFGDKSEPDGISKNYLDTKKDDDSSESDDEVILSMGNHSLASKGKELSVEYLEDECDLLQDVDDLDVSCGEFYGQTPRNDWNVCASSETIDMAIRPEERIELMQGPLEHGSTIIYVPTRKETLNIAKFLCRCGVKAAAYNAKLPKSHLRQVHKEFHENTVEVVVATIAFGMGIDKLNVRRIFHYGWPQSLEAYYQEAGRAGRDGKLADCVLYANLSRIPSLLPSKRSEEQTKQAYRMLSDCFRYGIHTTNCRAKALVQYFGEEFNHEKCLVYVILSSQVRCVSVMEGCLSHSLILAEGKSGKQLKDWGLHDLTPSEALGILSNMCDVCVKGPPEMQNLMDEAQTFLRVIAAHHDCVEMSKFLSIYLRIQEKVQTAGKTSKPHMSCHILPEICWSKHRIVTSGGIKNLFVPVAIESRHMQQLVHAIGSGSGKCEASLFTSLCSVREDLVVNLADDLKTDACFYEIENLKTLCTLSEIPSGQSSFLEGSYDDDNYRGNRRDRVSQKPNIKMFVSRIREQFQKFTATDHLWWRGLARILEDKGFIKEGDDRIHVQIKFPEPTKMGLEFLQTNGEQPFNVYPEADMLLSTTRRKPYSSFAEWGKGWADPEIRRQRLERKRSWRSPRKRKSRKRQPDMKTVRGRLAAKLSK